MRDNIGHRRHVAEFSQHDGTVDGVNQPTYDTAGDWDVQVSAWPCEAITTGGDERIRGRQTTAETRVVLFGEYYGASAVTTDMRCVLNGNTYGVAAVYDQDGEEREMRIELRLEQ